MCTPIDLLDDDDGDDAAAQYPYLYLGPGHAPLQDAPEHSTSSAPPAGPMLLTEYVHASGPDAAGLDSALTTLIGPHDFAGRPAGTLDADLPITGRVHGCGLSGLWLAWARFNMPVTLTIRPLLGFLIVCLPTGAMTGTIRPVSPTATAAPEPVSADVSADVSSNEADAPTTVLFPTSDFQRRTLTLDAHEGTLFIAVPPTSLHRRWRQLGGDDINPLQLRLPGPQPTDRLARVAEHVCREADLLAAARTPREPLPPLPPLDAVSLKDRLLDALLLDLDDTIDLTTAAHLARPADLNQQLAKRAVAWLRKNHHRPVTTAEMAADLGVGKRRIQNVFPATLGPTPLQVLRGIRLDTARDLLISEPDTPVGEIARKAGIPHYGRFPEYYRERFGEPPSATRPTE